MELLYRPSQPADYPACVPLIRDRYLFSPRLLDVLPTVWANLQREGILCGAVTVTADSNEHVLGFGASVFLAETFLDNYRASPVPELNALVLERARQGDRSHILSPPQIRRANTLEGLNLLILHPSWPDETLDPADALAAAMKLSDAFYAYHCGYNLREILACADAELCRHLFVAGFLLRTEFTAYSSVPRLCPNFVSLRREEALASPLSQAARLFHFPRPCFFFSDREQETLRLALEGATDDDLARRLCVSQAAVKRRWSTIYERVEALLPELYVHAGKERDISDRGERGSEKRRHLLRYLREHPEELRPLLPRKRIPSGLPLTDDF